MEKQKVNLVLVAITAISICFGVYGFMFGGSADEPDLPSSTNSEMTQRSADNEREPGTVDTDANGPETQPDSPASDAPERTTDPSPSDTSEPVTPAKDRTVAPPRGDKSISGRVIDPEGKALKGVTVAAIPDSSLPNIATASRGRPESPADLEKKLKALRMVVRTGITNTDGAFTISGVSDAERYTVEANHQHYGKVTRLDVTPGRELLLQFDSVDVTSGFVVDAEGKAIESISYASSSDGESWTNRDAQFGGNFSVRWRDHWKLIRIESPGYLPSEPFDVSTKGTSDLKVTLAPAPQLTVSVLSKLGKPVPMARIDVTEAKDQNGTAVNLETLSDISYRLTDIAGQTRFRSLPPGQYTLQCNVREGGPVTKKTIDLATDQVLEMTFDAGNQLTLRIADKDGRAINGGDVDMNDSSGNRLRLPSFETNKPGTLVFIGLPSELVSVTVKVEGWAANWLKVDMTSGDQDISVTLETGGSLKGMVTDVNGNKLGQLMLKFMPKDAAESGIYFSRYTNENGEYESPPLRPGEWSVEIYKGYAGERLAVEIITVTEGEAVRNFSVEAVCVVNVSVEFPADMDTDYATVWIYRDGKESPAEEYAGNGKITLTLREGSYTLAASTNTIASKMVEIEVAPGETNVVLTLTKPDALRFVWVQAGTKLYDSGVRTGDILLEVEGENVGSLADFDRVLEANSEKDTYPAVIRRGKMRIDVKLPKMSISLFLHPAVR